MNKKEFLKIALERSPRIATLHGVIEASADNMFENDKELLTCEIASKLTLIAIQAKQAEAKGEKFHSKELFELHCYFGYLWNLEGYNKL